jgi:hypothetical protein
VASAVFVSSTAPMIATMLRAKARGREAGARTAASHEAAAQR